MTRLSGGDEVLTRVLTVSVLFMSAVQGCAVPQGSEESDLATIEAKRTNLAGAVEKDPPSIQIDGVTSLIGRLGSQKAINFEGHSKGVTALVFTENGRNLISASRDATLRLWTVDDPRKFKIMRGHDKGVLTVALSPDGALVASGGWDRRIILWDLNSGKKIRQLRRHREGISSLVFTPDGQHIVSGSYDGSVNVWSVNSGALVATLAGHQFAVQAVAVSPNGDFIASAGADRMIRLWDLRNYTEINTLSGHSGIVKALTFTRDSQFLLSGGSDQNIILWNLTKSTQERTFQGQLFSVNALSVSADGRRLLATDHSAAHIWDIASGDRVSSGTQHQQLVTVATFAPSGNMVASAGDDGSIRVWEAPYGVLATRAGRISTPDAIVKLSGTIIDESLLAKVTFNDEPLTVAANGAFEISQRLVVGESSFILAAIDEWGNKAEYTLKVDRDVKLASTARLQPVDPFVRIGTSNKNGIAIIIGIQDYDKMPVAEFAENDAKLFYDFATNILGIPPERVKLLIGQKATRTEILKVASNWITSISNKSEADIFLYFAGHGLSTADGSDAYFLPFDGDAALLHDSAISRKRLLEELNVVKPRSTTLFLDTCYSGLSRSGKALASERPMLRLENSRFQLPKNTSILSAASRSEISISLQEQKHGLFTYFLMRGLQGEADTPPYGNSDGQLTLDEIHKYVLPNVAQYASGRGKKQHPELMGSGNFVVATW